jgi:hypothetical protein
VLTAVLTVSLLAPAAAHAQAPANDNFSGRATLALGGFSALSTFNAGIQGGEEFTANDPDGTLCEGVPMDATVWYTIPRNVTGRVTVTTEHSDYDTVLAVYRFDEPHFQFLSGTVCNNTMKPDAMTSRLRVTIDPNWEQVIQVGGCSGIPVNCRTGSGGNMRVDLERTPANDDREQAQPLAIGQPSAAVDTAGATTVSNEQLACGLNPYDKTVWYSFTAPSTGSVTFTASGENAVMAVYTGSAQTTGTCFDDPRPGVETSSMTLSTTPQTYLVQVGGAGATEADDGPLTVRADFNDPDLDDDLVLNGDDCAPSDPARSPLKQEIWNNAIDEDCVFGPAYDIDGDHVAAPPTGKDCDDHRKRVHPGARDVRGNSLNEDCVGGPLPFAHAASVVHWAWTPAGSSVRLNKLYVQPAPKKTRIEVRCHGAGCPIKKRTLKVKRAKGKVKLNSLFSGLLRPGLTIDVYVTKPETLGTGRRFKTSSGNLSDTLLCNSPKRKRWKRC